jgi:TolA-binding protein
MTSTTTPTTPPSLPPINKNKLTNETIETVLKNIATLQKTDYPNWRAIVKLQTQLIQLMSGALKEQQAAFKKINDQVTAMESRLKTNTIPINDMKTLAGILQPFLAKTYQANKATLAQETMT